MISFQHRSVQLLKQLEPRLQTGLLEGARPIDPVRMMREANADLYAPHYGAMDPELVEEMHAAGKAVGVWTVDDAAGVLWCRICKPDSVFTNRPREVMLTASIGNAGCPARACRQPMTCYWALRLDMKIWHGSCQ